MSYEQKSYTQWASAHLKKGVTSLTGQYLSFMFVQPLLIKQIELRTTFLLITHNLVVNDSCPYTVQISQ